MSSAGPRLLGPAEVRLLAERYAVRPAKRRGQNFVIDANTVRRIVAAAEVAPGEQVLEVGPGLGSLTLGLLAAGASVVAVEVDPTLAGALPATVAEFAGESSAERLQVVEADALDVDLTGFPPASALVANLPYNVAVPVLLRLLEEVPSLDRTLVMVQREVADRLSAVPGSRIYGVPSVKAAWYSDVKRAGAVSRTVFWPQPNVDSALLMLRRRRPPDVPVSRAQVFAVVDAAFGQRRKMLRAALSGIAPGGDATTALVAAGIDPTSRAERLTVAEFARLAEALDS